MARPNIEPIELRRWLIHNIEEPHLTSIAARQFAISRQTVNRVLIEMGKEGIISASGVTKARVYKLKRMAWVGKSFKVSPELKEDVVWRQDLASSIGELPSNVRDICQYGFTEMFNNVLAHSDANEVVISLERTALSIDIWVTDNGVGIFEKIQRKLKLEDQHHAILELCKGKLTTDPLHHSGEGVFFTSRMFDRFQILSHRLAFLSIPEDSSPHGRDWLIDVDTKEQEETIGTAILLRIAPDSPRVMQQVFDRYAAPNNNYGFTKTCIPVHLAKYGSEQLMSRSQARRLLAHFDRFVEVMLDFHEVEMIGQAFADEIFRVFQNERPNVHIDVVRAKPQVAGMIARAKSANTTDPTAFFDGMEPDKTEDDAKKDGSDDLAQDGI
jgi:anti-sigma regulatory factor (Ser/Thr protein kinase)